MMRRRGEGRFDDVCGVKKPSGLFQKAFFVLAMYLYFKYYN